LLSHILAETMWPFANAGALHWPACMRVQQRLCRYRWILKSSFTDQFYHR